MRESVLWFGKKMEQKLQVNDNKPGWEGLSDAYLLKRLNDEHQELLEALDHESPEAIIMECADIANFAMMLADKRRQHSGPRFRGCPQDSVDGHFISKGE